MRTLKKIVFEDMDLIAQNQNVNLIDYANTELSKLGKTTTEWSIEQCKYQWYKENPSAVINMLISDLQNLPEKERVEFIKNKFEIRLK